MIPREQFVRGARVRQREDSRAVEMGGVLHTNTRVRAGKDADMFGSVCIRGVEYFVRGWWQEGNGPDQFLALRLHEQGADS